ncbi:hypothetical protein ABVK25_001848 [Lepraria finkii]|uniref:Domain of unknown function at the cortex 1 domain-containing protein n=1 Tax=Lepraria finkii TaxID=1340010 RepID=A0ABR4BKK2_9LECA
MADKYLLKVTSGPSYDPATHQTVQVNTSNSTHVTSPICDVNLSVRIQNYHGLPRNSPTTSPYFSHPPPHTRPIQHRLLSPPKIPIPGPSLLFGNDFDRPIRDRLPPGFGTALKIVKWGIDPGLDGDVYSDTPYLYGNALSSINVLRVGEKADKVEDLEEVLEEGGDGDGEEWRKSHDVPDSADARKKHFLMHGKTEEWEWEEGRVYKADFFNTYLDFNSFSLKLPGFSLSVLPYLGGEDHLRYVLKNKDTDEVLFVVVFTLLHKEDVEKEEAESGTAAKAEQPDQDGEDRHEEEENFEPRAEDLD